MDKLFTNILLSLLALLILGLGGCFGILFYRALHLFDGMELVLALGFSCIAGVFAVLFGSWVLYIAWADK